MAHYAFLNENNMVTEVIKGIDETELIDGIEPEIWYGNFRNQTCKRTSLNTFAGEHSLNGLPFRKNYAGVGFYYDESKNAFIPPKVFESWILNEDTCQWQPPIPCPNDGKMYDWNENTQEWIEIQE